MWVGRRPIIAEAAERIGVEVRHIDELRDHLAKDIGAQLSLAVIPQVDAAVEAMVQEIREQNGPAGGDDFALKEAASEQRLVKDAFEIAELRTAVDATIRGFEQVISQLPEAVAHTRGERVIEGVFARTARADGNGVGYDTIAAAGEIGRAHV